ncbi:MAG: hypothetical protein ACR2IJ_09300 [Fluviibacter sp.]
MAEFDELSQQYGVAQPMPLAEKYGIDPAQLAPNFAPQQGINQMVPSGGGYSPAPVAGPGMNPDLQALLMQYTTGAPDYGADLKTARTERQAQEKAFNTTLDSLLKGADEGPSKAEMYFRLAAALGKPTKFGSFGESLGPVAESLAEYQGDIRKSGQAKRKLATDIALKKQELSLEAAKDTEKTLLGLQSEASKDKREFIKAQVKEYIDSGKPASEAGKIAFDILRSKNPGKSQAAITSSPEYGAEVDNQAKLLVEQKMAAINASLVGAQASLVGAKATAEKAERESIKLEPDERKSIRDDEDAIYAAKNTVANLNSALGLVDQAFTNTAADQAQYKKLKQTNPSDPRVKATEELENLVGLNVVGSLKTTFGGNPTEGERRALQELGGLGSANKEVRKAIMKRAAKALEEAVDYRGLRIKKIETGGYRKKTEPEGKK